MKLTSIILIPVSLALFAVLIGCAPPSTMQETGPALTPEQHAARQDSLRKANETELKMIRSFAYSHYTNKNWPDAAKYYAELAEKDTAGMFNDYGKWAQCYISMSVPADSVKMVYEIGLSRFPEDAYLHASLGFIFRTQGLLEEAAMRYEKAIQYNEEDLDYKKTLAELYVRLDRPLDAIGLYRVILEKEPDNKSVAETLADLVRRNLSPEEYVKSLENAIVQFPDDLGKKYDLAKAYSNMSRNEDALGQLQKIINVDPKNVRALKLMGDVNQNLRKFTPAVNAYLKILDIENNAEIMVEVSNVYRDLGNYTQARSYAQKALAINSKMGSAYVAQAAIYEDAADKKTKGTPPGYKDKLVFIIAYGLYDKAVKSGDYSVMDQARNHMNYLKESKLVPEYSDWFMHQNEKDPTKGGGYDWINSAWPEFSYIETYLNQVSQK